MRSQRLYNASVGLNPKVDKLERPNFNLRGWPNQIDFSLQLEPYDTDYVVTRKRDTNEFVETTKEEGPRREGPSEHDIIGQLCKKMHQTMFKNIVISVNDS